MARKKKGSNKSDFENPKFPWGEEERNRIWEKYKNKRIPRDYNWRRKSADEKGS